MTTMGIAGVRIITMGWKIKKSLNLLGLGFISAFFGSLMLFLRLLNPAEWDFFLSLSITFYTVAVTLFYAHFQLSRTDFFEKWKIGIIILLLNGVILHNQLSIILQAIDTHFGLTTHFLIFLLTSYLGLIIPIIITIQEFRLYRIKQQFIEGIGFAILLLGANLLTVAFFTNSFGSLTYLISLFCAALGGSFLALAYLINPAYIYRVPFEFYSILGFHDSGMVFYQQEMLHLGIEKSEKRTKLIGSYLTTIKSYFKMFLEQEMQEFIQQGDAMVVYMKRDPLKKIGYAVITTKSTWYLRRIIKRLLDETPGDLIEDDQAEPLDIKQMREILDPIVKRLFPYFELLMKNKN